MAWSQNAPNNAIQCKLAVFDALLNFPLENHQSLFKSVETPQKSFVT
jgi:hypothetical protein